MKHLAWALACALCLAGCMASGVQVSETDVAKFHKGKTTYAEVVAALGQPTSNTISSDGKRIAMYTYMQVQARPESFIPYVGAFVGGADSKSSFAMFTFDSSGVLESYSASSGAMGMGTGLESGTQPNGRTPNQPQSNPN